MNIKAGLKRWVPPQLRLAWRKRRADAQLLAEALRDWQRFRRHSGIHEQDTREVLAARIWKTFHRLEKGLALSQPRPGFGPDAIASLQRDVQVSMAHYGPDRLTRAAVNTLRAYAAFHQGLGMALPDLQRQIEAMEAVQQGLHAHGEGGVVRIHKAVLEQQLSGLDFERFAQSRVSVRQFAPGAVSHQAVESAVRAAQKAPSVCNRQAGLVYAVRDPAMRARILAHQNGNRGFGDQADLILIVGSKLPNFLNVGERYQAWIDGGMFAMSLVHGLHAQGLGTCCLNWSVTRGQDKALRREAGLPEDVEIMMLLAVGHLPSSFEVAQSPRRPLSEVLHELG